MTSVLLAYACSEGPAGDTGTMGEKGDVGASGAAGEKGDTGAQGPKGDTGATGGIGEMGPQGPAGSGVIWVNSEGEQVRAFGIDPDLLTYFDDNGSVWQVVPSTGQVKAYGDFSYVVAYESIDCTGDAYLTSGVTNDFFPPRFTFKVKHDGTFRISDDTEQKILRTTCSNHPFSNSNACNTFGCTKETGAGDQKNTIPLSSTTIVTPPEISNLPWHPEYQN